eukprot:3961037-Pyramimonas_sp.AAC.1
MFEGGDGDVGRLALQRVMSPTATTVDFQNQQVAMHFRQCRACFDVLVGPSVACGHCGAEVHAHCVQ